MSDDNFYNDLDQFELQESLKQRRKDRELDKIIDAQDAAQADGKFLQDSLAQAMEEAGLDQKSYNELYKANPEIVKQSIQKSIRDHTARMRDSRGRYVKAQPGQPAPQKSQTNIVSTSAPPATGALTQSLKEKVDKGYVPTEEEILNSIGEMIGGSGSLIE